MDMGCGQGNTFQEKRSQNGTGVSLQQQNGEKKHN